MTDKELRCKMEQSAEDGRRALFDEYCGYVYAICANKLKGCGTSEDVDECLSDTFAAVFRYLNSHTGADGDLRGIIGTIAKRTAISYFRRLSPKSETTISIDSESLGELPSDIKIEENAERSALREAVFDCLKRLGEPDSTIIAYFYYYGMKTKQISSLVGLSDTAVQKRLSRSRKKLKELLSEAGITEEGYQ
ncbi:MAG: sigma-70 family RNA polymerase sigma factor [Ruminococcus sp.]|uniref:RNA polymerase sigma factor n=1 Tax=Ruminococcus sp. TaxID=41978 RepID=UPI0025EE1A68|nr:sigma-70 family RNA polymerase sigma factor [Ruminococcus sp.]MCR5600678.1 sigma-70 family RNA polymerase sigma factor [Ruminococcus sp.]